MHTKIYDSFIIFKFQKRHLCPPKNHCAIACKTLKYDNFHFEHIKTMNIIFISITPLLD